MIQNTYRLNRDKGPKFKWKHIIILLLIGIAIACIFAHFAA